MCIRCTACYLQYASICSRHVLYYKIIISCASYSSLIFCCLARSERGKKVLTKMYCTAASYCIIRYIFDVALIIALKLMCYLCRDVRFIFFLMNVVVDSTRWTQVALEHGAMHTISSEILKNIKQRSKLKSNFSITYSETVNPTEYSSIHINYIYTICISGMDKLAIEK